MTRFTFNRLGRTLLMLTAVIAVGLTGCGGDDNPNNGGGGGGNHDSRLVNANGEAWLEGSSCASARSGYIFKSNGDFIVLDDYGNDYLEVAGEAATWRTDGNKLIGRSTVSGGEESALYEISNGSLILTNEDGDRMPYKKCGVNVGW